MRQPLQITYRRVEPSNGIETCVRDRVSALESCYDAIISCDVLIESGGSDRLPDLGLHIHLDVCLPGRELDVDREAQGPEAGRNIVAELQTAFSEMERQVKDYVRHAGVPASAGHLSGRGVVSELVAAMNYGLISTPEGIEVYFHRNQVIDGAFDRLRIGSTVEFSVAPSLLGAQATRVKLVS
jgi:cold shock CspA family protein/ribosome-associated translation inhibitor RaiA